MKQSEGVLGSGLGFSLIDWGPDLGPPLELTTLPLLSFSVQVSLFCVLSLVFMTSP